MFFGGDNQVWQIVKSCAVSYFKNQLSLRMRQLYLFSGLGADERAFQNLHLAGCHPHFIQWLPPLPKENMAQYARRLAAQITTENPVLIGLSFGGMVAAEVARLMPVEKLILISSAKTRHEIPPYYRLAGRLGLDKLMPVKTCTKPGRLNDWLFGCQSKADKELLAQILRETDPVFFKWAIGQIVRWQNTALHHNLVHIHGSTDRILPIGFVRPDFTIKNGGHFMVVNKADEVNGILRQILQ